MTHGAGGHGQRRAPGPPRAPGARRRPRDDHVDQRDRLRPRHRGGRADRRHRRRHQLPRPVAPTGGRSRLSRIPRPSTPRRPEGRPARRRHGRAPGRHHAARRGASTSSSRDARHRAVTIARPTATAATRSGGARSDRHTGAERSARRRSSSAGRGSAGAGGGWPGPRHPRGIERIRVAEEDAPMADRRAHPARAPTAAPARRGCGRGSHRLPRHAALGQGDRDRRPRPGPAGRHRDGRRRR